MSYDDGSGQISRRPRVNDGPAPVSGVVAIVLAVVAVVAGYLILRSITDSGDTASPLNPGGGGQVTPGDGTQPTNTDPLTTAETLPPEPTDPPTLPVGPSKLIVANANGRSGSADQAGRVLESSAGFTLVDPTNDTASSPDIDTSLIYYDPSDPDAQAVANTLNTVLGGQLNVTELPAEIPITEGDMKGATVLLMLGKDFNQLAPGQLDLTGITGGDNTTPAQTNPTNEPETTEASG